MRGPPKESPGTDHAAAGAQKSGTEFNRSKDSNNDDPAQLPFVDRFGNEHGEAVLKHWSKSVQRAMGLRRADEANGEPAGGAA